MRLALVLLALAGVLGGASYRRLEPDEEVRFYRSAGEAFLGRCVHLHLPPAPFLKRPGPVQPARGGPHYHLYIHRGVRFLVRPDNPYYGQFRRKAKAGGVVCVKGRVARFGPPIGVAVVIHRIRALPRATCGVSPSSPAVAGLVDLRASCRRALPRLDG